MAGRWYYQHDGARHGPVRGSDLKRLADAGRLLPTDLIWKEGMDRWVPARKAAGLFPTRPTVPPTVSWFPSDPTSPDRKPSDEIAVGDDGVTSKVSPPRVPFATPARPGPKSSPTGRVVPPPLPDDVSFGIGRGRVGPRAKAVVGGVCLLLGFLAVGAISIVGGGTGAAVVGGKGPVEGSWSEFKTLGWKQKSPPQSLAFLSDGKTLAVCGKSVCLIDIDSGAETEIVPPSTDSTRYSDITSSPAGRRLAWCKDKDLSENDETCGVVIWDTSRRQTLGNLAHMKPNAFGKPYLPGTYQRFNSDARLLVTSVTYTDRGGKSTDNDKLWDADTLQLLADLPGCGGGAEVSADGTMVAMHGRKRASMTVWDVSRGREVSTVTVPRKGYDLTPGFVLHPDGKTLLTVSSKSVLLWDTATGQTVRRLVVFGTPGRGSSRHQFSPDGLKLAAITESNDGWGKSPSVVVWDVSSWRAAELRGDDIAPITTRIAFSPRGDMLAFAQRDGAIRVYREQPGQGGKYAYREQGGEPADWAGRTQEELDAMENLAQIMDRLGPPDEAYRGTRKRNVRLAVWDDGEGTFITVGYIEAIDGVTPPVVMAKAVGRPREVVENLKRLTESH